MYWAVAAALVVGGYLGGFSIGQPFLVIGLAMLALGRVRHRWRIWLPLMAGVVAFNLVYWALVPISCRATAELGRPSTTICINLVGSRFEGGSGYVPPRGQALVAGFVAAVVTTAVVGLTGLAVAAVRPHLD